MAEAALTAAPGAPLRVLLLDSIPKWGGGEKWCVEAANALRERGHHAAVACAAGSPLEARSREAGIPTWAAPLGRVTWIPAAFRLARYLAGERIEAVVGNVGRDLWIGALACRSSGAHLVQRRGLVRPVKSNPISRALYTRKVERVIVNSLAIRDCMLESASFLDPGKFVLIPNGIDLRRPPAGDRSAVRRALGISAEAPVAATIGRLAPMKGQADLLRAWPRVVASLPRSRLLIVGEGEEDEALRRLAQDLGVSASVSFLGFRRDIPDLLEALDVLVLPSVRDEGCSNTLLEAMWHSRPAVVTRCGGLPEVVRDGETGLVVPVHDIELLGTAILRLLANREEQERMGAAARGALEREYSLDRATDRLVELLLSLRG